METSCCSFITTLIGPEFRAREQEDKWIGSVVSVSWNNSRKRIRVSSPGASPAFSSPCTEFQQRATKIYGIPCSARRVVTFHPATNSQTFIGPDLGIDRLKWGEGTADKKGNIYCMPSGYATCEVLKINTNNDTVQKLDLDLPLYGPCLWGKGVLALDGNIYYMPEAARFMLKLDPINETVEHVGGDLGRGAFKYYGAVLGVDGCIYGIPDQSNRVVKYNPMTQETTFIGEELGKDFQCVGNGAIARDGCIYAAKWDGIVLKIDTIHDSWSWVGNKVETNGDEEFIYEWGDAVLGIDGCLYWPPRNANRTLRYDPYLNQSILVGCDFGDGCDKWAGGVLAPDGLIYCMPSDATRVLAIDPFREFMVNLERDMHRYPIEEFGRLFLMYEQNDDGDNDDGSCSRSCTPYDLAVMKFGHSKVFHAVAGHLPATHLPCASGLYPFMEAASYPSIDLSIVYHLLREVPYVLSL